MLRYLVVSARDFHRAHSPNPMRQAMRGAKKTRLRDWIKIKNSKAPAAKRIEDGIF
jgi:hypothetical protein